MSLTTISGEIQSQPLNDNFSYLNERKDDIGINVKDFGAIGDGISDDTSSFQAALDYAYTNRANVFIPKGKYNISSELTMYQGVSIIGADKYGTKIYPTNPNMNVFSLTGVALLSIIGFSIENLTSNDNIIGIYLDNVNRIDIKNVEFMGLKYCWYSVDGGNNSFSFCTSREGNLQKSGGFFMGSSQGGDIFGEGNYGSVISTINNCVFKAGATVRDEYIKMKRLANLLISNCEFIGSASDKSCMTIHDDSQGVHISNCAINSWDIGILVEIGTYAGETNRAPRSIIITNTEFDQNQTNSIKIIEGESIKISNCSITSSGVATSSNPIYLGTNCIDGIISQCSIGGYAGVGGIGISLDGCDNILVENNIFNTVETAIDFTSVGSKIFITNNNFKIAVTNKFGGDPSGSNNRISQNFDNPLLNVAPSVPADSVTITNDTGYDVLLSIEEGSASSTLTGVVVNNSLIRINKYGSIPIKANDTIKLFYSLTPTWTWLTQR